MTGLAFGYLILISIDFYDFSSISVVSLVLVSIKRKRYIKHSRHCFISKHLEVRTNFPVHVEFQHSSRVFKNVMTRLFVFDGLLIIRTVI